MDILIIDSAVIIIPINEISYTLWNILVIYYVCNMFGTQCMPWVLQLIDNDIDFHFISLVSFQHALVLLLSVALQKQIFIVTLCVILHYYPCTKCESDGLLHNNWLQNMCKTK